jgi:dTDP-D-glucose 4,6-dehydratase
LPAKRGYQPQRFPFYLEAEGLKTLVTGGPGFIGSAAVRHIIENTHDSVINVDKLTYAGNLSSLVTIDTSDRYRFYRADIYNRGALEAIFDAIDASKIERELGWVPEETFESGIEKTVS